MRDQTKPALAPAGGNPATGDKFWGRKDELERLAERIRNRCHTLIEGHRRIGKTSLLMEFGNRYKNEFNFIFVDLQDARTVKDAIATLAANVLCYHSSIYQQAAKLFAFLHAQVPDVDLKLQKDGLTVKLKDFLTPGNWKSKGEGVFDLLAKLDKPTVLCFDEISVFINTLLEVQGEVQEAPRAAAHAEAKQFLFFLRHMSQRKGKLCMIYCGSIGFTPILNRTDLSETVNTFDRFSVDLWRDDTAIGCLCALANYKNLAYEPSAESILVEQLRYCVPNHVQILSTELHDQCQRRNSDLITHSDVESTLKNLWSGHKGKQELNRYIKHLQQIFEPDDFELAERILTETARNDMLSDTVFDAFCRQAAIVSNSRVEMVKDCLIDEFYLEKIPGGYRFVMPLLHQLWQKHYK